MASSTPLVNKTPSGPHAIVGNRLRLLRLRRGWQLKVAARQIGIGETYLCKIEQGHRLPRRALMERFARLYRVDIQQLYGGNTDWRARTATSDEETFFPVEAALASA